MVHNVNNNPAPTTPAEEEEMEEILLQRWLDAMAERGR